MVNVVGLGFVRVPVQAERRLRRVAIVAVGGVGRRCARKVSGACVAPATPKNMETGPTLDRTNRP